MSLKGRGFSRADEPVHCYSHEGFSPSGGTCRSALSTENRFLDSARNDAATCKLLVEHSSDPRKPHLPRGLKSARDDKLKQRDGAPEGAPLPDSRYAASRKIRGQKSYAPNSKIRAAKKLRCKPGDQNPLAGQAGLAPVFLRHKKFGQLQVAGRCDLQIARRAHHYMYRSAGTLDQ